MIEMAVVLGILGVVTSMAVFQIGGSRPSYIGDGAMRVILSQMNQAREMAITQRRNMRVTFSLGNKVEIFRERVGAEVLTMPPCSIPAVATGCLISTVFLEGNMAFALVPAMAGPPPTAALPDSPDLYGFATATHFQLAGVNATEIKFTTEGTLVNQDGQTINGSVFLSLPNSVKERKRSARVITVLGSTGRIRGYKWDGVQWKIV
jgi:type II secretory pathway pseudopilin PulG